MASRAQYDSIVRPEARNTTFFYDVSLIYKSHRAAW